MIEFRGLYKSFETAERGSAERASGRAPQTPKKWVLAGIDLTILRGSIQFIVGMSGAGKSVLMKHVVGLLRPDAGRVWFEGTDITDYSEAEFFRVRAKVALVFQHSTLFDSMTLVDNVALPIEKRMGVSTKEACRQANEVLETLHLGEWAARMPSDVGAGLKKRVAIARAIALHPSYIIYDEPTTGLDPVAARNVDALILELKGHGVTQIVVSHDLRSIFDVADRIAFLHQGRVHFEGTKAQILESRDPIVVQFIRGQPEGPLG